MAELADAQASGACGSNIVRVQVPFPASFCGSVGTGRRARLRILWLLQSCGFKSHLPHVKSLEFSRLLNFCAVMAVSLYGIQNDKSGISGMLKKMKEEMRC